MKPVACVWMLVAGSAALAAQTPAKSELDKLQGSWVVTAASGQDAQPGAVVGLVVTGNKYQGSKNGKVDETGTITVDSSRKPATIDLVIATGSGAGKTQVGLVEVVDDTMKLVLTDPGNLVRPTALAGEVLTATRIKPLPQALIGDWDGVLKAAGAEMRLTIKLKNGADGLATGTMVSVDQGNREAPIAAVVVRGARVTIMMPAIRGIYDGQLKDGQLTGTWTQPGGTVPLALKRKS